MSRRYSGPRHLTPGWARPFGPRWITSAGLTTLASPPPPLPPPVDAAGGGRGQDRRLGGQRRGGGGADRRVLAAEQFAGLRRPGQQLAVEGEPVGPELGPQSSRGDRAGDAAQQLPLDRAVGEERPPGPGVDHSRPAVRDAEPPGRYGLVRAGDHHRPPSHLLLLPDHIRPPLPP